MIDETTVFQAKHITSHTLLGVGGDEFPLSHGNCFSVAESDGREYGVVNFNLENLEELQRLGLKFPLRCMRLTDNSALIDDPRIGERWYAKRYCEICCPKHMLPSTQLDTHRRDILRGVRTEHGNCTSYRFDVKPEFA